MEEVWLQGHLVLKEEEPQVKDEVIEPSYYKLESNNTKACLATDFTRFKATKNTSVFTNGPEPVRVQGDSDFNQVVYLDSQNEESCSALESEGGACGVTLQPDPTVNFMSLTILGLRVIFIKTIIFNVLLTFRLWISQCAVIVSLQLSLGSPPEFSSRNSPLSEPERRESRLCLHCLFLRSDWLLLLLLENHPPHSFHRMWSPDEDELHEDACVRGGGGSASVLTGSQQHITQEVKKKTVMRVQQHEALRSESDKHPPADRKPQSVSNTWWKTKMSAAERVSEPTGTLIMTANKHQNMFTLNYHHHHHHHHHHSEVNNPVLCPSPVDLCSETVYCDTHFIM
ncbi:M1-specific T cell receptor alpha chain-like [Xyrichtys novacula]|nr:M1-specific T cell receptor alpha chain-like [Xyrichtys novacula]